MLESISFLSYSEALGDTKLGLIIYNLHLPLSMYSLPDEWKRESTGENKEGLALLMLSGL